MSKVVIDLSKYLGKANKLILDECKEELKDNYREYYIKSAYAIAARKVLNQTKDEKFFIFGRGEKQDTKKFDEFMSLKPKVKNYGFFFKK